MVYTPYQQDESSHVGYALSLRQGELPSTSTPVPTEGGGEHLGVALSRPWPFSVPNIHVANNPPFVYLASLPFVELAIRTQVTDGPLLVLRLVDVIGAVAAIGLAYLLGRELSGGDRFAGLVTAGLLSSVIAISLVSSVANVDGPALAATTGVTWMTARFARTRALRDATVLGVWCAGAAAVRPMSAAFAAVAGAIALLLGVRTRGMAALVPLVTRLAVPTVLLSGWFYGLNWHRYGDMTGSGSQSGPGLFDLLTGPDVSVEPFAYLVTEVYGRNPWWEYEGLRHYLIAAAGAGVVITAVALAAWSSRSAPARRDETELSPAAWISTAVLALVPIVVTAQHVSNGGAGHARYLFPILPIVGAATALVASRINRWLAVVVVGAFAIAQITRIRAAGNIHDGALSITPPPLHHSLVDQPLLGLSVAVAIVGAVALLASLVRLATQPAGQQSSSGDSSPSRT
ncbi:MAG: glycosyltransferase family 39 protein [Acidimicrobiales bacterium]